MSACRIASRLRYRYRYRYRRAAGLVATLLLGLQANAFAQPDVGRPAAESRIARVKVYPGSATVERVARVAAGSRTLTFSCLPAGIDVQSLHVDGDPAVRIGETSVLTEPRALSARCATSELDGRIREFEVQKDALQAESDALALVAGYLKGMSGTTDDGAGKHVPVDAKGLVAVADALRRTGQDALQKQFQIARRRVEIERQLAPLLAERTRTQGSDGGSVTAVSVTLAAQADGDVRLSYQVAGPGWTPSYRAILDTETKKVRIERQALVAQATGEDWRGVKLVLSTGQPRRETAGRVPGPWRIGIEPPQRASEMAMRYAAPSIAIPSPAPMSAAKALDAVERRDEPLFDVSVFEGGFATEFSVAQPIDVPSSGQRVAMSLGQHEETAGLAVRTSPRLDASAFLIAELAPPEGVWPAGPMQLWRDGAFVGNGRWSTAGTARLTLSFGRDELVRVEAEPERDSQGSGGFVGSRTERRIERRYTIENRHRTPIAVQVLEAAPVAVDEQVRVAAQFVPQPAELAWQKQPGVALWRLDLGPGQTTRVAADYTIAWPKEARLQER